MSARVWAEQHCGDDDPMDVFEHKLLAIGKKQVQRAGRSYTREEGLLSIDIEAIEERFVIDNGERDAFGVEPEPEF